MFSGSQLGLCALGGFKALGSLQTHGGNIKGLYRGHNGFI